MPQKSTACTPVHPWYSRDAQKSEKASNGCSPGTQRPELSCWISSEDIPQWLCDHSSASLSFGASRIHCLDSRQIRYGKGIIWKYNYIKGKEKKTQQEKKHNNTWARQAESGWPSAQETWPLGAAQGHKAVQVHTASSQSHWFCDGDVWPAAPAQRLGWAVCVWLHLYHREWDRKTQLAQPLSTDAFSSVGPWFSSWHPPRQQLPPAFPSSKERFAWRIRSSNFSRQKRSGKQVFPLKGEKVLCS